MVDTLVVYYGWKRSSLLDGTCFRCSFCNGSWFFSRVLSFVGVFLRACAYGRRWDKLARLTLDLSSMLTLLWAIALAAFLCVARNA